MPEFIAFREPKEVTLETWGGVKKTFVISKLTYFAGREVLTQFPTTAAPKIGDYRKNEELAKLMFNFIAVKLEGNNNIVLSNDAAIENHCNIMCGLMLEKEMLEYNADFLANGEILNFLNTLIVKAKELISRTLMDLPVQSSQKKKRPSVSLKNTTRPKKRS